MNSLMSTDKKTLMIYAPVPLFQGPSGFLLEDQACNGLRLWAENFERVIGLYPVDPGQPPQSWCPIERVGPALQRVDLVPLPMAYRPDQFARHYRKTRDLIRKKIAQADYLSFSIGGLFGDWGSVACYQAHRMGRPYAVWTDRVESEVVRRTAHTGRWRRRMLAHLSHRPMAHLERFLIRRAELGLFHGRETFDTYAPYCSNPQMVHDIHIKKSEHISPEQVAAKAEQAQSGPLQIAYVGRADPMKGGFDWVDVLSGLNQSGISFQATWFGEGTDLEGMKARVTERGLADSVSFPGFLRDRGAVLEALRKADLFLFCHKSPESPRCLIEALVSGTPIVGYDGAFARDLISQHKAGRLVPLNDVAALEGAVRDLNSDRAALGRMIADAARDGADFDDEHVFKHRSDVIRQFL